MNITQIMKSDRKYLGKEDVTTTGTDAIIAMVVIGEVGDDVKPILSFMGGLKPMVLNKTNAGVLSSLFGEETDNWSGKQINVYCDPHVTYQAQVVGGVKVRPSAAQPAGVNIAQNTLQAPLTIAQVQEYEREQRATAQSMAAMPNDDIPF